MTRRKNNPSPVATRRRRAARLRLARRKRNLSRGRTGWRLTGLVGLPSNGSDGSPRQRSAAGLRLGGPASNDASTSGSATSSHFSGRRLPTKKDSSGRSEGSAPHCPVSCCRDRYPCDRTPCSAPTNPPRLIRDRPSHGCRGSAWHCAPSDSDLVAADPNGPSPAHRSCCAIALTLRSDPSVIHIGSSADGKRSHGWGRLVLSDSAEGKTNE